MATESPKTVVIVGGSLAGLMHGLVFKRLGWHVHILERQPASRMEGQGAGITAQDDLQEFLRRYKLMDPPYSVKSPNIQILGSTGAVSRTLGIVFQMTSWNVLYYRLRAAFDGLPSKYYPEGAMDEEHSGCMCTYEHEQTVTDLKVTRKRGTIVYYDDNIGTPCTLTADLVIGADGPRSRIRWLLELDAECQYVGYVAWRGTVVESEVSEETRRAFDTKTTFCASKRSYILMYTIPGENGSVKPGERLLNWVWYCNYAKGSDEFADIMTDVNNHQHRHTLPMGLMRDEAWSAQKAIAAKTLAPPFVELVTKTAQPFIAAVNDTPLRNASYFDGRILLVGDALATLRPHAALSTNQAALNALLLEKVMRGTITMDQWERAVLSYARVTAWRSKVIGLYFLAGFSTFFVTLLRYGFALGWRWLRGTGHSQFAPRKSSRFAL